jgi:hypothetical protein
MSAYIKRSNPTDLSQMARRNMYGASVIYEYRRNSMNKTFYQNQAMTGISQIFINDHIRGSG